MSSPDREQAETFRPWGWPAVDAVFLLAFAAVIVMTGPWWVWLVIAPLWAYGFYAMVLSMSVELSLGADELRWRTLVGRGVADLRLVMAVDPGPGQSHASIRIILVADGQRVRVGEGPEFDRLLRALRQRIADLDVRL